MEVHHKFENEEEDDFEIPKIEDMSDENENISPIADCSKMEINSGEAGFDDPLNLIVKDETELSCDSDITDRIMDENWLDDDEFLPEENPTGR